MTEYNIRHAVASDITYLSHNMRDYDREEVYASDRFTPFEALCNAFGRAQEAFTATADDEPFCMFGVAPLTTLGGGSPWLLTSQDIVNHQKQLIKYSAPVAHYWRDHMYPYLINFIDARHRPGLRWAKHIGFEIKEPIPFGPFQMPFNPIIMRR